MPGLGARDQRVIHAYARVGEYPADNLESPIGFLNDVTGIRAMGDCVLSATCIVDRAQAQVVGRNQCVVRPADDYGTQAPHSLCCAESSSCEEQEG